MTKNILILTLVFLSSCRTKPTDAVSNGLDSLRVSTINNREDFGEFFEKFKIDSLFQLERTRFPWYMLMATED